MPFLRIALSAVCGLLLGISTAQASLVNLGDGTVKDTDTNLIWLRDWNMNGQKDWATQMAWAEGLTFANSSAWVLPTPDQYFTLWAEEGCRIGFPCANGIGLADRGFINVEQARYWAVTGNGDSARTFNAFSGFPDGNLVNELWFAVAVRQAEALVPEPANLALVGIGLAGIAASRRRRPVAN